MNQSGKYYHLHLRAGCLHTGLLIVVCIWQDLGGVLCTAALHECAEGRLEIFAGLMDGHISTWAVDPRMFVVEGAG